MRKLSCVLSLVVSLILISSAQAQTPAFEVLKTSDNTSLFKVLENGRIGIGITEPSALLHLHGGTLRIQNSIDENPSIKLYGGTGLEFGSLSSINTGGTDGGLRIRGRRAGTDEASAVTIEGSARRDASNVNPVFLFDAQRITNTSDVVDIADASRDTFVNRPLFGFRNLNTRLLTIHATGAVGIGLDNPSEKLSVKGRIESTEGGFKFPDGTVQTTAASTPSGSTDHGNLVGLEDDDHPQYTHLAGRTGGQVLFGGDGSGDDLVLRTTSDNTKGNVLLADDGGNVGIGTNTPVQKLDVRGGILRIQNGLARNPFLKVYGSTGKEFLFLKSRNDDGFLGGAELGSRRMGDNIGAAFQLSALAQHDQVDSEAVIRLHALRVTDTTDPDEIDAASTSSFSSRRLLDVYNGISTSAPLFTVHASGNVGVGIAAPGNRLSVAGTIESTSGGFRFPDGSVQAKAASDGITDHGELDGRSDDDHSQYGLLGGRAGGQIFIGGTGPGDDLYLRSSSHGTKGDILLTDTGGNVGIGTPNPEAKLNVVNGTIRLGTAASGHLRLEANGANAQVDIKSAKNGLTQTSIGLWTQDSGGSLAERVRVVGDGRVGILTQDPEGLFHIGATNSQNNLTTANITSSSAIHMGGTHQWAGQILLGSSEGANYFWYQIGKWDAANSVLASSGYTLVLNPLGGDVGIGTPNQVSNILTIKQNSGSDPIADAWTTYSSRRWKTNVAPISSALVRVQQLRGVSYNWIADGKADIGLIAEEVGAIFPEIVTYEANGEDARSLDYARLVPVLIEAMKEQQGLIEAQEERLHALEELVRQLAIQVKQ